MRFWLTIVLLSFLCCPTIRGEQRIDEFNEAGESLAITDAVNYTTEGVKNLRLFNNPEEAKLLFEMAIESDSTYAPAHFSLAEILVSNSVDSAYHHAQKAHQLDKTNSWYLSTYAQISAMLQNFDEAQSLYEELLDIQPHNINAYRVLAILHNQQQEPMKAVAILDSAELKVGRNPYLVDLKNQILLSNNQVDRVIEEAKEAIDSEPYSIENRLALAELYRNLKRDSMALQSYKETLALDSMRLEVLFSLGDYLKVKGDNVAYMGVVNRILSSSEIDERHKIDFVKEIVNDKKLYHDNYLSVGVILTTMLLQYPDNEEILDMQVKHLIALNMLDEALVMLKSRLDIEPPSLKIHRTVIDIERYKGRVDSVELYLNRTIERFPEESDLRFEHAFTLTTQKRYDEAIELFESYLDGANDSLSGSIWGIIGDVHHQVAQEDPANNKLFKKRLKMSYKAYDRALEYLPDNAMVLNNYAYFLCEYGGDLKQALKMAERATELYDSNPTFIDTYAWILYRLGRYDDAKVSMRRAISFDSTQNGEIALHYGEILAALGEMTMANYYWDKALEWGISEEVVQSSRKAAEALLINNDNVKGDE